MRMKEELLHKIERLERKISELKQTVRSQELLPSEGFEKRRKKRLLIPLVVLITLVAVGLAMAAEIPHSFGTGGVISATKFNENFSYIVDRLWDKNNSDLYFNGGNVGIGTIPEAGSLLHVSSGTSGDAVMIMEADTDNNGEEDNPYIEFRQDGGTVSRIGRSGTTDNYFSDQIANSFYMYGAMAGSGIQFATGATPASRMYIDETGNVGIGTTSPAQKLDVNGVALIQGGDGVLMLRETAAGTGEYELRAGGSDLSFRDITAGETRMIIDNIGNVGIGTTSPAGKLEVVGTGVSLIVSGGTGISQRHLGLGIEGGVTGSPQLYLYATANTNGAAYAIQGLRSGLANDASLALNPDGGLVGIGTTTPGQKLDIAAGHGRVASGYSWLTNSDSRFKKNIATLENSLEKVTRLRGVRYDLDTDDDVETGQGKHIGIIAQELEKEYPEFVEEDPEGYKSVAYDKLSSVLIEAVKEQQNQIGKLKAENDALKILVCQDHPEAALCM